MVIGTLRTPNPACKRQTEQLEQVEKRSKTTAMAMVTRHLDTNEPSEIQDPPKSSIVMVGTHNVLTMFSQCAFNSCNVLTILFTMYSQFLFLLD